jgi:hypothetical protein
MSEAAQQWLNGIPDHAACVACAVRPPGQVAIQRTWDPAVATESFEYATRAVSDLFRVLRLHRLPSHYLQWTFEQGVLHCLRREDDWLFVVLVRRDVPLSESVLAELGQGFMALEAPA